MRKPKLLLIFILLLFTSCSSPPPTIEVGVFTNEDLVGSVKQDTSCFHGPDPRFGIATELDQNLQISIIGASTGGNYAVIVDPAYSSKLCWVKIETIDIHSADLRKAFEMVSIIHPDVVSDRSSFTEQDLLEMFMKLNVTDPDSDGGTPYFEKVPVIHDCLKEKDPQGDPIIVEAGGEQETQATALALEKTAEAKAKAEALHIGCSNVFLPGLCHSSETIDRIKSECGELVYPVFYFTKEDCSGILGCATSTPPPVVFIPCTPVPPFSAPVILNLALCWNGPGLGYEVISSVEENTVVEVLGAGVDGDHVVITNPRYNRPCWVNETDIELNGFDLTGLPIFGIPEQDRSQDSSSDSRNSQEFGCLVSSSPSVAPKCIVPCPDPVAYPHTCEP